MLDVVPPIHTPGDGRRKRSAKRHADKGYVCRRRRDACRKRRIKHGIALAGVEPKGRLGRHRRVVKRTLAWLKRYRGLTVRHERQADIYQAFLTLACCLVGHKHLPYDEF